MLSKLRIGFGFDTHKLEAGRELFIGGVLIDSSPLGALGHSDADVLLHAICDAILGAASLGDIGSHFPDNNDKWKNIRSTKLLSLVHDIIKQKKISIINIDSTIVLEKPKLYNKKLEMQQVIADILKISNDRVSVKATTNENLGHIGRCEGISAYATAALQAP